MAVLDFAQYALFLLLVLLATVPAGRYMERIFTGDAGLLERMLGPLERGIYRLMGVDPR